MKFNQFIIEKIFKPYSFRFERKRKDLFYEFFNPKSDDKILDLGGDDGRRMAILFPDKRKDIYIADISHRALETAKSKYGFETILLDESGEIPFRDNYFDITFCNSVIEHVTVDKNEMFADISETEFIVKSMLRQKKFADEIKRVSKKYFVQTPNKHFIIESHTWFPSFFIYFPRWFQIKTILFLNKFWIKKASPDFNLLTVNDMKLLFPEANLIKEKSFFMTKSMIVIKN
jgi:hypothetical protein